MKDIILITTLKFHSVIKKSFSGKAIISFPPISPEYAILLKPWNRFHKIHFLIGTFLTQFFNKKNIFHPMYLKKSQLNFLKKTLKSRSNFSEKNLWTTISAKIGMLN